MKLHFLGTGAADWDISKPSRDMDYRRFSSLLIDGVLLLDPGPCVFEFAETFGYGDLAHGIRHIANTHRHGDYYCEETVKKLCENGAKYHELKRGEPDLIGGYALTACEANHGTCAVANHIAVEDSEGKKLFYCCDGSWFLYDTYEKICSFKPDMLIFDCTVGDAEGDYRIFEHNNIRMVLEMAMTLKPHCGRFMVSHMAKTLHGTHEQLCERLMPHGIVPAHDNMVVQL
ncbi:MAG: hypothetical protein FWG34_09660 [Oscillospiraceae bacterium]|nr:hypothetical protein [Oscillospiraceae bacterium]